MLLDWISIERAHQGVSQRVTKLHYQHHQQNDPTDLASCGLINHNAAKDTNNNTIKHSKTYINTYLFNSNNQHVCVVYIHIYSITIIFIKESCVAFF
jgi:hypothetical protein